MKWLVAIAVFFSVSTTFGQKLKFKLDIKDTTVFLVKYYGKGMYYADTAVMKNGVCEFNGAKQKPGVMAVLLPGQKYFDFIFNGEETFIEASGPDYPAAMVVKKSEENKIFADYVRFLSKKRKEANDATTERNALKKDSPEYKEKTEKIEKLNKEVSQYQKELVAKHSNMLVGKVVKSSMEIEVPEPPRDANGVLLDSTFSYRYYRDHFFDNIDLRDDRTIYTPFFHNKLEDYFSKRMMLQIPDTVIKYACLLCDRLDPKSEMFKYVVTHITSTYEKSTIVNMDKVFQRMGDKYYCTLDKDGKSPAYWMEADKLETLCDKVKTLRNLVQGVRPPNISLRDTTDVNWRNFYDIRADYTILYFWDPDCGHCKTSTPKLQQLYREKLKARNVEVFAIAKAVGPEEFKRWKKFIKDNNMTFINVGLTDNLYNEAVKDPRQFVPKYTSLEALNYQETFDVFSTPKVFVLDKDKNILVKQLSISQLEDFLDQLQKYKGPKIIPPDPEDKEKETH